LCVYLCVCVCVCIPVEKVKGQCRLFNQ